MEVLTTRRNRAYAGVIEVYAVWSISVLARLTIFLPMSKKLCTRGVCKVMVNTDVLQTWNSTRK